MIHSIPLSLVFFSVSYYTLEDSFKTHKCHSYYKILGQLYILVKSARFPPRPPLFFLTVKLVICSFPEFLEF